MGSFYKRKHRKPDGTIVESPTIWIKYYQNGRAVRESTGTTKETKARRMLRAREGDVEHGIPINPKMGRVTFEDAAKDFLNDYKTNKRRSLAEAERRITKHLMPFFKGRQLARITTADVRAFVAKRQADRIVTRKARVDVPACTKGVSNGEINRELAILKRMFSLAVNAGLLYVKPHIPMLTENNVRRGFFEPEQFRAVCGKLPAPIAAVARFAYMTGWRVKAEILPLEWRQIDWRGRVVRLDAGTTKNNEGRTFPFTNALEVLLKEQLAEHERLKKGERVVRLVFHRDGTQIRSYRGAWRRACAAAGLAGRIPHDFRRTAVRNLERAGVPRSTAMAMVGHRTEAIYRRYAIVDEQMQREAAAKIDAAAGVTGTISGTTTA